MDNWTNGPMSAMTEWRSVANGLRVAAVSVAIAIYSQPVATQEPTLSARLIALRLDAKLPAVAGATFSSTVVSDVTAIGRRKVGDETPVAADDLWHIGSITKSFTSLLVARHVERGELAWTTTLGE